MGRVGAMEVKAPKVSQAEQDEKAHFRRIVQALQAYQRDALVRLRQAQRHLGQLPAPQHALLSQLGYGGHLKELETLVTANHVVITAMIADVSTMFVNVEEEGGNQALGEALEGEAQRGRLATRPEDVDKIHSTLKQLVRDWSSEGREERQSTYQPIVDELLRAFPQPKGIKVLVPGAGLGRLAFDITQAGFDCQGNEFSLFMLFASNFVLNQCQATHCYTIYPWIHQFVNNLSREHMTQAVSFPDVDPNELNQAAEFSMTAGDFLEVYSQPEYLASQDCVATCFFLDCANNVLDFIELIHRVLKPGGRWINFGPLLYHFSDVPGEFSIEPSYDILKGAIQKSGFEFLMEKTRVPVKYTQNAQSMLQYEYQCVFFHCQKTLN